MSNIIQLKVCFETRMQVGRDNFIKLVLFIKDNQVIKTVDNSLEEFEVENRRILSQEDIEDTTVM